MAPNDAGSPVVGHAKASPTKDFFVKMLTRDIDLVDAILDLLDNCLDGILRSATKNAEAGLPYAGYWAKLTFSSSKFVIEDNCGGIPFDVATRYAFAMGRPPAIPDASIATIGMYGIGMKRAIFKLGTNAIVESRFADEEGFFVEITPEWMADEGWDDLPIRRAGQATSKPPGTTITVLELNEDVQKFFGDAASIEEFKRVVSKHYSLIIAKGFSVQVGTLDELNKGEGAIPAQPFKLLQKTNRTEGSATGIAPFLYTGQIDGVSVSIFAGLYRPLLSEDELEAEENARSSSDDAGWTVACNDRVVIWKDKTRLTGWGEASVPNYHGQFIPITGIVLLKSSDPRLLPLTTTKRGIDASSNVYSTVKDLMREATKSLTSFTNRWKPFPAERESLYRDTEYVELPQLIASLTDNSLAMNSMRRFDNVKRFEPVLPDPPREKTDQRISFLADRRQVDALGRHMFGDEDWRPADLGKAAFEFTFENIDWEEQ